MHSDEGGEGSIESQRGKDDPQRCLRSKRGEKGCTLCRHGDQEGWMFSSVSE